MALFGKHSKLYAMFGFKCPRCHQGDLFETSTFSYKKPFEIKEQCEVCQQDFAPEPGYYYGAMFISYIFTGFFCLGFVMITHWVLDWSMAWSFGALIAVCAIFFVYVFRLARSIYINIDQSYDPSRNQ
jgi:uncharacterized protein (DUF983 family)